MIVKTWPLSRIKPYPKNARVIPQAAIDKVALSLRTFGWQQPMVVEPDGTLIVGHVRRLGALENGWTEGQVTVARDLTAAQIKAYRLMDNRSHDEATWNLELAGAELLELQAMNFDLKLTGFERLEIREMTAPVGLTDPDEVPPTPAEPVTRTGDVWLLGEHRVLCGDCTDAATVEKALGGAQPILMVTDPPYGISLDSEWRDRAGLNNTDHLKSGGGQRNKRGQQDAPSTPSYMKHRVEGHTETSISGDTRADWSEAFALVPSIQVVYVWHASVHTAEVQAGLLRIGFLYPQQIIWNKMRTVLTRTHYWFQHEPCWYARKKNAPWYGKPGENSTIWESTSPKFMMGGSKAPGDEKIDHPTQKPVDLMRRPILNHTKPGEVVYEPFHGSGSTLIAAEMAGRVCVGTELEPRYCDVIVQRWERFTGKQATLEGDGRMFAEVAAERKKPPANGPGGGTESVPVASGEAVPGDLVLALGGHDV